MGTSNVDWDALRAMNIHSDTLLRWMDKIEGVPDFQEIDNQSQQEPSNQNQQEPSFEHQLSIDHQPPHHGSRHLFDNNVDEFWAAQSDINDHGSVLLQVFPPTETEDGMKDPPFSRQVEFIQQETEDNFWFEYMNIDIDTFDPLRGLDSDQPLLPDLNTVYPDSTSLTADAAPREDEEALQALAQAPIVIPLVSLQPRPISIQQPVPRPTQVPRPPHSMAPVKKEPVRRPKKGVTYNPDDDEEDVQAFVNQSYERSDSRTLRDKEKQITEAIQLFHIKGWENIRIANALHLVFPDKSVAALKSAGTRILGTKRKQVSGNKRKRQVEDHGEDDDDEDVRSPPAKRIRAEPAEVLLDISFLVLLNPLSSQIIDHDSSVGALFRVLRIQAPGWPEGLHVRLLRFYVEGRDSSRDGPQDVSRQPTDPLSRPHPTPERNY